MGNFNSAEESTIKRKVFVVKLQLSIVIIFQVPNTKFVWGL